MSDRAIPLSTILVYGLWALVSLGLISTWVATLAGNPHLGQALSLTTCVSTGIAAVVTIRAYVMRVCGLIRLLHHVENGPNPIDLHSVP